MDHVYHLTSTHRLVNPRYSAMVLAISVAWFATSSASLFADELVFRPSGTNLSNLPRPAGEAWVSDNNGPHVCASTRWISDRKSSIDADSPDGRTNLPTPTEEPASPNGRRGDSRTLSEASSSQGNQDKQTVLRSAENTPEDNADKLEHGSKSAQQPVCFVPAPTSRLTVDVSLPAGLLPQDIAALHAATAAPRDDSRFHGNWVPTQHHWSATRQTHRPLYFEEAGAERYGYTSAYYLQPLISAGRFFLTIPALPYKMVVDRPRDDIYTLGHYRPGSSTPWRLQRVSYQVGAAIVQTGFVAGLILLIP